MIKLENVEVFGFEAAIRGMRNPMNSWHKSDSDFSFVAPDGTPCIGENDLKLMKTLSKAGHDHGKYLRMINVTLDITAPLYWWKEFDTYKVGTVANSCSTMHKIHAKEFTLDDFSHEHLDCSTKFMLAHDFEDGLDCYVTSNSLLELICSVLNEYRKMFIEATDSDIKKLFWWQMIQLLPSSYNQKRTVQLNYQVLKTMYHARKHHKLDEWVEFCKWCETLPYFKEVVLDE